MSECRNHPECPICGPIVSGDRGQDGSRIATLESQLAAAERTIAEQGRYIELANATVLRLDSELDEAKRVAVWAFKQVAFAPQVAERVFYHPLVGNVDGTDADIYRALEEAMKGVE